MKLSQLRPCDRCGGMLGPIFHVLRCSIAVVNVATANQVLGMAQYFQGALALAEVMSPDDHAIEIAGDLKPELWLTTLLCVECHRALLGQAEVRAAAAAAE